MPALPLIVNRKTVDPTDPSSPEVIQTETAMGAAIGVFDGARALCVPRSRFVPVKTTDDLLALRSDVYRLLGDGRVEGVAEPPYIALDPVPLQARRGLRGALPARPALAARLHALRRPRRRDASAVASWRGAAWRSAPTSRTTRCWRGCTVQPWRR